MQRGPRPGGTVEVIVSPTDIVVETEPRHEQATARRMLMPLQKRQVFLLKSSAPMMFDLILDGMNGFWPLRDAHTESAITLLPAKVVPGYNIGARSLVLKIQCLLREQKVLAMADYILAFRILKHCFTKLFLLAPDLS